MFKPYENGTESHSIHDLTLENDVDVVNLSGNLQITKDQQGLATARALQDYINAIVSTLEAQTDLPETLDRPELGEVDNPFL